LLPISLRNNVPERRSDSRTDEEIGMNALVSYRLESNVATIAMDDGKMNALSPQLLGELASAFERAERDGAVVVLEGAAIEQDSAEFRARVSATAAG
jgi:enoyl-CoA hydratase/carnithine racemase